MYTLVEMFYNDNNIINIVPEKQRLKTKKSSFSLHLYVNFVVEFRAFDECFFYVFLFYLDK